MEWPALGVILALHSRLGLEGLQQEPVWRGALGLRARRACPTLALALPCEVALGAPLTPSVSASPLSLCLDGLRCAKHREELPDAWILAAINLFLWFTNFKILCVV